METPKNDRQKPEQLNNTYSDWISVFRKILQQPEISLSLNKRTSSVGNVKKVWHEFGGMLLDEHLDNYRQIVVEVLREKDPKFELPEEERFAANIRGKVLKHSAELRKGLAESLALLGNQPEVLKKCSFGKTKEIVCTSIREILKDSDWILWGSVNNLLPTLAEAAPEEFLTAVENALEKTPCPFDELFSQESGGITGGNYMAGLLWALETLAWEEQYLIKITLLLGELASRDPGGSWNNRPANSLSTIFLSWFPQTLASVEKRKVAVETLNEKFPEIAWELVLKLLPNQHQSSSGSAKPVWRKIIPDDWGKGITNKEYWDQITNYSEIAVETAKSDFNKLNELISKLHNLPKPSFNNCLDYLKSEEITESSEEIRAPLWETLTKLIVKHRKYSDADWALKSETVDEIEEVSKKLALKKPTNLYRRLFNQSAMDLSEEKFGEGLSYQEQEDKIGKLRQDAIREIFTDGGLGAVFQFAEFVKNPQEVGGSLGVVAESYMDLEILPNMLETENEKLDLLVRGYVWARRFINGWEWIDQIDVSKWSSKQIAKLLTYLPFTEEVWQYAEKLLGEDEAEYWCKVNVNPYQIKGNLDVAIDKLIKFKRPNAAISCMYKLLHDKKQFDKSKATSALLDAVISDESTYAMDMHQTLDIIKALQDEPEMDQNDLFGIEWAYVSLLTGPGRDAKPKLLERELASNPEFFWKAISLLYKSRKETDSKKESTEDEKKITENIWRLLEDWSTIPGMQPGGTFSSEAFNEWLKSVRAMSEESGHLEMAMLTLGKVLIHYVPDPDGLWIHKTLAEALDSKDADEIRRGFYLGVMNSRGAHFIDPTGKPEKDLAAQYRQKAEKVEDASYKHFAKTLRDLAKSYEEEAKRNIEEHKKESQEDEV